MNGGVIVTWILANKEIVALLAAIAAGIGALYEPIRDLMTALPHILWALVKFAFRLFWLIIWPLRKLTVALYVQFAEKYIDNLFEKISEHLDKMEAAKARIKDKNSPI